MLKLPVHSFLFLTLLLFPPDALSDFSKLSYKWILHDPNPEQHKRVQSLSGAHDIDFP